jgi:hypothetical protein
MTTTPDPSNTTAEALAEAAWWHLLNRHDLAQVLDELGAVSGNRAQLLAAVEQLANGATKHSPHARSTPSALFTPTGGNR